MNINTLFKYDTHTHTHTHTEMQAIKQHLQTVSPVQQQEEHYWKEEDEALDDVSNHPQWQTNRPGELTHSTTQY